MRTSERGYESSRRDREAVAFSFVLLLLPSSSTACPASLLHGMRTAGPRGAISCTVSQAKRALIRAHHARISIPLLPLFRPTQHANTRAFP